MACPITWGGHKNLKPGLFASHDIRPGNGEGLFWFWHFISLSLTHLLRHLPIYLQPQDPHGAKAINMEYKSAVSKCPNYLIIVSQIIRIKSIYTQ